MRAVVLLAVALLAGAGCLAQDGDEAPDVAADLPMHHVDDPWYDVGAGERYADHSAHYLAGSFVGTGAGYHTLDDFMARVRAYNETHPQLVEVNVIGHSRDGRELLEVVVTDESVTGPKLTPVHDGGHHGNEYAGAELVLYTIDVLLQNHATNRTVQQWLRDLEVHFVPLVNPDGYQARSRGNALGVNLNRNYDIDWGNPLGASNPLMGTVADAAGRPVPTLAVVAENCGPSAFSEPETQAVRDLMRRLADTHAFYISGHTPFHSTLLPWSAYEPPFPIPPHHEEVFQHEMAWIEEHTSYTAGRGAWGNFEAGAPYNASGNSADWYYANFQRPAMIVEVEYIATAATYDGVDPYLGEYEGLRFWMEETVPIALFSLANADLLAQWQEPDRPVPELAPAP